MKKLILTTTILLGLSFTSFADPTGGGVFQRGNTGSGYRDNESLNTPAMPAHGWDTDQSAPIGSGILVLTALGAAYLVGKRRKEE